MSDLFGIALTMTWVLLFLFTTEILSRKDKISKEVARKVIHISVGHVIFFLPLFETRWIAAGIPFVFTFGNLLLSPISPIKKMRLKTFAAGHTFGTVLYPLALSIVTWIAFDFPYFIIIAFFPVMYGDGLAAVIGPIKPIKSFEFYNGTKTIGGTLTVFVASFISIVIGIYIMDSIYNNILFNVGTLLLIDGLIAAIIATIVELISYKGTDNITIPVVLILIFKIAIF